MCVCVEANLPELEDDESLVDEAVRGEAFHFLRRCVVNSPHFHQEVCWYACVHVLVVTCNFDYLYRS